MNGIRCHHAKKTQARFLILLVAPVSGQNHSYRFGDEANHPAAGFLKGLSWVFTVGGPTAVLVYAEDRLLVMTEVQDFERGQWTWYLYCLGTRGCGLKAYIEAFSPKRPHGKEKPDKTVVNEEKELFEP